MFLDSIQKIFRTNHLQG
ncbi:DUF1563 domain-containing protein [Mesobacillus maritimus]